MAASRPRVEAHDRQPSHGQPPLRAARHAAVRVFAIRRGAAALPEVRAPQRVPECRALQDARCGLGAGSHAPVGRGRPGLLHAAHPPCDAEVLSTGLGRGDGRPEVPRELFWRSGALSREGLLNPW